MTLLCVLLAAALAASCSKWRTLSECSRVVHTINPRLEAIRERLVKTEAGAREGDAGLEAPAAALPRSKDARWASAQYTELVDALQALKLENVHLDAAVNSYVSLLKTTVRELDTLQPGRPHRAANAKERKTKKQRAAQAAARQATPPSVVAEAREGGSQYRPGPPRPGPAVASSVTTPPRPPPRRVTTAAKAAAVPAPSAPISALARALEREKSVVERIDRVCQTP